VNPSPLAGEDLPSEGGRMRGRRTYQAKALTLNGNRGATPHPSASPTPSPARGEGPLGVLRDVLVPSRGRRRKPLRRLLQGLVQEVDRRVAVDAFDGGDFAGHAVEGRFVQLPLGIGLLGLGFGPVQVADDLGD